MSTTTKAPLGPTTTNRKWYLDLKVPTAPVLERLFGADYATEYPTLTPGSYVGLFGITEFKFNPGTGETQDSSDFDGEGWKSNEVTAISWGGEGKVRRGTLKTDRRKYDPGQELLRKTARTVGIENDLTVRVYEMEPGGPRVEAYEGEISAMWTPDGGNMAALDMVSFTLNPKGKLREIAHPDVDADDDGIPASEDPDDDE